jgi:hypothetical protein
MLIDIFCHDRHRAFTMAAARSQHGANHSGIWLIYKTFTIRQIVSQVKSQNGDAKVA